MDIRVGMHGVRVGKCCIIARTYKATVKKYIIAFYESYTCTSIFQFTLWRIVKLIGNIRFLLRMTVSVTGAHL